MSDEMRAVSHLTVLTDCRWLSDDVYVSETWVTKQLLPNCSQFAECPFREKEIIFRNSAIILFPVIHASCQLCPSVLIPDSCCSMFL